MCHLPEESTNVHRFQLHLPARRPLAVRTPDPVRNCRCIVTLMPRVIDWIEAK